MPSVNINIESQSNGSEHIGVRGYGNHAIDFDEAMEMETDMTKTISKQPLLPQQQSPRISSASKR